MDALPHEQDRCAQLVASLTTVATIKAFAVTSHLPKAGLAYI